MNLNVSGCRQLVVMMVIQAFRDVRENFQALRLLNRMGNHIWLTDEYFSYLEKKNIKVRSFADWRREKKRALFYRITEIDDAEQWLRSVHCAELRQLVGIDGFGDKNMMDAIERVKLGPRVNWSAWQAALE